MIINKQFIAKATVLSYDDTDSIIDLCFEYLKDASKDIGREGDTACELLDLARKIIKFPYES